MKFALSPAHNFRASWNARAPAPCVRTMRVRAVAGPRGARRKQNVPGDVFVDQTCINCDTCRWMVPEVFDCVEGKSAAVQQPSSAELRARALQAVVACPTGSIRTEFPAPEMRAIAESFPIPIASAHELGAEVYHLGYHCKSSYGATPYLIMDRDTGVNIMVDSPRFSSKLARSIEAVGGVDYIYLTHIDDVADHAKFASYFGAKRIIHALEANPSRSPDIDDCEILLQGSGPWEPFEGSKDAKIYFQPGHTNGHTALVYKSVVAFTGDHIAQMRTTKKLGAFETFCWYSLEELANSILYLRDEIGKSVKLILPGHGRAHRSDTMWDDLDVLAKHIKDL